MLDTDTKRRIDTARDILVGKVPDPKSRGVAPGWYGMGLWPKAMLPPLATQQAIVAEIEAEQALVAANRELITRFEQKIQATLARIWGEEKGEG